MIARNIKTGYTLTELLVVIVIMSVLVVIGVPAVKSVQESFNSTAGVKTMISKALGNARAIALKEQTYAGVRFQRAADGRQYMVLVIHDPADPPTKAAVEADPTLTGTGLANGYRAVAGRKPMSLPEQVIVCDDLRDTQNKNSTTLTVVFTPAGRLEQRPVRVSNRHGQGDSGWLSPDKLFNIISVIDAGNAMFVQDYIDDEEASVKSCNIYDTGKKAFEKIYINSYTGEVVNN